MRTKRFHLGNKWFTLVELLVGMTVFSIGITAIFVLLTQTMKASVYSRNEVVVANLLREQIELVRNIRDTNLAMYAPWDKAYIGNGSAKSLTGGTFIIENDFSMTGVVFNGSDIEKTPVFMSGVSIADLDEFDDRMVLEQKLNATRLYFDDQKRYTHTATLTGTQFASYVILSPLGYYPDPNNPDPLTFSGITDNDNKPQWYIIDARVLVKDGSQYREYDAKSTVTDWVR